MKKFILSILILLIAVPGFAQYGQLGGGIAGISLEGTSIIFGSPADSVIFEIPVSFESTITITTLIGTSFKIFNTEGDSMIFNPNGFSSANSAVAGTAVFNYKSRGGHSVIIDSLSAYISVYDSPVANVALMQLGTSDDADRFKVDEDGDVTNDGSTNSAGGFTDGTFTVDGSGNFTGMGSITDGTYTSDGSGNFSAIGTIGTTGAATFGSTGSFESTLTINPTVVDGEDPSIILKADADSDSPANTSEALTINLAAATDPTMAMWTINGTQTDRLGFGGGIRFMLLDVGAPSADRDAGFFVSDDGNDLAHQITWDDGAGYWFMSNSITVASALNVGGTTNDQFSTSGISSSTSQAFVTTGSGDDILWDANTAGQAEVSVGVDGDVDEFKIVATTILVPNAASNAGTSVADDAAITVTHNIMRMVGADAEAVLDTDPAVNDGTADGQIVIIQGTADGNLVTIADNVNTQLAGGNSMTLGDGDVLCLMWDSNYSMWIEQYRADN